MFGNTTQSTSPRPLRAAVGAGIAGLVLGATGSVAVPAFAGETYKVASGDSLAKIAQEHGYSGAPSVGLAIPTRRAPRRRSPWGSGFSPAKAGAPGRGVQPSSVCADRPDRPSRRGAARGGLPRVPAAGRFSQVRFAAGFRGTSPL